MTDRHGRGSDSLSKRRTLNVKTAHGSRKGQSTIGTAWIRKQYLHSMSYLLYLYWDTIHIHNIFPLKSIRLSGFSIRTMLCNYSHQFQSIVIPSQKDPHIHLQQRPFSPPLSPRQSLFYLCFYGFAWCGISYKWHHKYAAFCAGSAVKVRPCCWYLIPFHGGEYSTARMFHILFTPQLVGIWGVSTSGHCKSWCYEHLSTHFCVNICLHFSWVCCVTW